MTSILSQPRRLDPELLAGEVRALVSPGTVLRVNEPMARRTTFRVGGPADVFAEPVSEQDLSALLRFSKENGWPVLFLGRGSNLLVKDKGVRGLVISLANAAFSAIQVEGCQFVCGAGARLKTLSVTARQHSVSGFEFLEGIPGSVGGALRMNAGAMGSAVFDRVEWVRFMDLDGAVHQVAAGQLQVSYRCCAGLKNRLAVAASLVGVAAERDVIEQRMREFSGKRWSSQPAAPSAGCVFKNPQCAAAGRIIDELGLKGLRVGGAVVSSEHGNFIVNEGSATAADLLELIEAVRARVWSARGVSLETEVQIVGE